MASVGARRSQSRRTIWPPAATNTVLMLAGSPFPVPKVQHLGRIQATSC